MRNPMFELRNCPIPVTVNVMSTESLACMTVAALSWSSRMVIFTELTPRRI